MSARSRTPSGAEDSRFESHGSPTRCDASLGARPSRVFAWPRPVTPRGVLALPPAVALAPKPRMEHGPQLAWKCYRPGTASSKKNPKHVRSQSVPRWVLAGASTPRSPAGDTGRTLVKSGSSGSLQKLASKQSVRTPRPWHTAVSRVLMIGFGRLRARRVGPPRLAHGRSTSTTMRFLAVWKQRGARSRRRRRRWRCDRRYAPRHRCSRLAISPLTDLLTPGGAAPSPT